MRFYFTFVTVVLGLVSISYAIGGDHFRALIAAVVAGLCAALREVRFDG